MNIPDSVSQATDLSCWHIMPHDQFPTSAGAAVREVQFQHSPSLPALLEQLRISLLVSTYQAGKLIAVGARGGQLALSFHNFDHCMGIGVGPDRLAISGGQQIWTLRSMPDLVPKLEPAGQFDGCYLSRSSVFTGPIDTHEMAWAGDELWVVNTLFSCLCTVHPDYNFVPRWMPPFISALAPEDRCHLNGMAWDAGRPKFVTAMSETDTKEGWRPDKAHSGCVIEVPSGRVVARGFAMPHSPRWYQGNLWLLDSGRGQFLRLDPATGQKDIIGDLPGYTRGLAFHDSYAFVGLSRIRETSTFGGVPLAARRETLKCGLAVIDLTTRACVATLEFKSGVTEIFDLQVLPGTSHPALHGPHAETDGQPPVWAVPSPRPAWK